MKAILFDFDGTLLNNFHAVYMTAKEVASHYGILNLSEKQFRARVRLPFTSTISSLGLSSIAEDELKRSYVEIYQRRMHDVALFPDVKAALRKLRNNSLRTGVVTDTPRFLILKFLDDLHLRGYFDVIVCGDDTKKPKPSPLPILLAARKLGHLQPREMMYVGDMAEDVVAARSAGIISCAIYRRGLNFHSLARLRDSAPELIVSSLKELTQTILS